jgi:hypothetical protein
MSAEALGVLGGKAEDELALETDEGRKELGREAAVVVARANGACGSDLRTGVDEVDAMVGCSTSAGSSGRQARASLLSLRALSKFPALSSTSAHAVYSAGLSRPIR